MDAAQLNLDALGWFQFERLTQVLLKAELGLGVESWGGRGDYGRDAFAKGPLKFPARDVESNGPFVFQSKFIEGANVPGADFAPRVLSAARSEASRVRTRMAKANWSVPNHYALLTNAPLSPDLRMRITTALKDAANNVVALGGQDISDMLARNPAVARTFPQILGLHNLKELLEDIVNKDTLKRSEAAVRLAQDIAVVFVPTRAYNNAWRILSRHRFAVLEGPPEMGKTAIAWMVALAQLANGWEAIACDEPNDLFRSHRPDVPQVFVADDAFGRTEYDPTMGGKWEKQLGRIRTTLDDRHWLIWTSRRHILERALREMDLQTPVEDFPNPGDVLVTASQLSDEEKGLILYRHAKAAKLEASAKTLLRKYVKIVTRDPSFTPERIRRFVHESIPRIEEKTRDGKASPQFILNEIREAIKNPTDRMIKSFRALGSDYKWLLIALLEQGHSPIIEDVRASFSRLSNGESGTTFDQLLEELSEGFIKI
jgi:hypothetical protein